MEVQALGDPTFNYIKLLDKEATRQSALSGDDYLEMVDKYVVEISVTRLPRDVARFPDENIFLHLMTVSIDNKQICRFNAGACDEFHGGKKCYCKKVIGHEYHFIANCTARLEDSVHLRASWQNNQGTKSVNSGFLIVPSIMKYPDKNIFYPRPVTEHNSAILLCDLKRANYRAPLKTSVTVQAMSVLKRHLKSDEVLAEYSYNQSAIGRNPVQKAINAHITASKGRVVATLDGMCQHGCEYGLDQNEDTARIVIVFNNVTCEDADMYTCRVKFRYTYSLPVARMPKKLTVQGRMERIIGSVTPDKTLYREDETVTFTCRTKGPRRVRILWKFQTCATNSQPNPSIEDWKHASDILHNSKRIKVSGGCKKREIISKLKNVHLHINDQRICLIRCEAIFKGDHKKWNKHIKYVNPEIETTTLTPEQTSTTFDELDFSESLTSIGTTTLTPQTTERTFNNQGRNKRCNAFEYGPSCEHLCNDNCAKEGLCDEDTGVCHNGCKPGFNPPDCEKRCEKGTYSVNCSKSCVNCAKNYTTGEHICEHSTGECYFGCDKGYGGDTCEKLIVLPQVYHIFTAKNITFLSLLTLLIVVLARSFLRKGTHDSTIESDNVHPIQRINSFGTDDSKTPTGFESTMESDITDELGSSVDESSTSDVPELPPVMTSRKLCPIHGKQCSGHQMSVQSSASWATTLDSSTELSSVTTSNGQSDSSSVSKWSLGIFKYH